MSLLFFGFAMMNYATARDYRTLIRGDGGSGGLDAELRALTQEVEAREAELDELRRRMELERASKRGALAALERSAVGLSQEVNEAQSAYVALAGEQRQRNENIQAVQEEVVRLTDEAQQMRRTLTDAVSARDTAFAEVTELVDKLNQGEGALRRLRERQRQLSEMRR